MGSRQCVLRLHVPEFVEPENWRRIAQTLTQWTVQSGKHSQQIFYRRRHIRDAEHLKEVLQTCWEQIGQDVIDRAIGQFRKQLSLVVATSGGHIEHRFDLCFWCYTYVIILVKELSTDSALVFWQR